MNTTLTIQQRVQHFMLANGMIYSIVQISILVYAAIALLPLLGPPDASVIQRYEGYAKNTFLFKMGNYLMGLPALFFFAFLGGIYAYFNKLHESIRGILFAALLSGAVLIMIWPFGAVISLLGVDIAAIGGDQVVGGAFDSIVPYSLGLSTIPRVIFLCALSVLLIHHNWLSFSGFLIAALSLAGNLILVSGNFLPMSVGSALLFQVWVFFVSLKMYRNKTD